MDVGPGEQEVVFNPATKHWYCYHFTFPEDSLPTRLGPVKIDSLTQKKKVIDFATFNLDHFQKFDIHFMKDERGLIGIFTLVLGHDFGSFYRTDRGGFSYKSV